MRRLDLLGKKLGKLTCIKDVGRDRNNNVLWLCACECGGESVVVARDLKSGHTKSCGCLEQKNVAKRYEKLTVIGEVDKRNGKDYYLCQCDCGNQKVVMRGNLIQGNTKSCGCLRKQAPYNKTHGLSRDNEGKKTRLYRIWTGMKTRCLNKNDKAYPAYGGRGILLCNKWLNFRDFYDWAHTNGYRDDLTIERINNDGNYEPDNCKWITLGEQALNRRNTIKSKNKEAV